MILRKLMIIMIITISNVAIVWLLPLFFGKFQISYLNDRTVLIDFIVISQRKYMYTIIALK